MLIETFCFVFLLHKSWCYTHISHARGKIECIALWDTLCCTVCCLEYLEISQIVMKFCDWVWQRYQRSQAVKPFTVHPIMSCQSFMIKPSGLKERESFIFSSLRFVVLHTVHNIMSGICQWASFSFNTCECHGIQYKISKINEKKNQISKSYTEKSNKSL